MQGFESSEHSHYVCISVLITVNSFKLDSVMWQSNDVNLTMFIFTEKDALLLSHLDEYKRCRKFCVPLCPSTFPTALISTLHSWLLLVKCFPRYGVRGVGYSRNLPAMLYLPNSLASVVSSMRLQLFAPLFTIAILSSVIKA